MIRPAGRLKTRLLASLLTVVAFAAVALFGDVTRVGAQAVRAGFDVEGDRLAGEPIQFTDRSTGAAWVYWNFGDGTTSRERNPVHRFAEPGAHQITYTVCATRDDCASERREVVIAAAPATDHGTGSADPTTFAGDDPPSANETDSADELDADWEFGSLPSAGVDLAFVDRSTGPVAWVYWNFGDGNTSRETDPTHRYARPGVYEVRYSVCASRDRCVTDRRLVTIEAADEAPLTEVEGPTTNGSDRVDAENGDPSTGEPGSGAPDEAPTTGPGAVSVAIAYAPAPPVAGQEIQLISRVAGVANDEAASWIYRWEFADGTRSLQPFPRRVFPEAGTESVRLTVCVPLGSCFDPVVETIAILETSTAGPPVFDLLVDPDPARLGSPVTARIDSGGVEALGTFFLFDRNGVFSAPGRATSFEMIPSRVGVDQLTVAVCFRVVILRCELIDREIEVLDRLVPGSIDDPRPPGEMTIVSLADGRRRLLWTDDNEGEDGYEVWAGETPADVSLLAGVGPGATGILVADGDPRCFVVRARFGTAPGPGATACDLEPVDGIALRQTATSTDGPDGAIGLELDAARAGAVDLCWSRVGSGEDPQRSWLNRFGGASWTRDDEGRRVRTTSMSIERLVAGGTYRIVAQAGTGASGPAAQCAIAPGLDVATLTVTVAETAGDDTDLGPDDPAFSIWPALPTVGETVTFLHRRPAIHNRHQWDFGDGTGLHPQSTRTHVYTEAGDHLVEIVGCDTCEPQLITVLPAGITSPPTAAGSLRAPDTLTYRGWRGHPTVLTWQDSNDAESGYEVYITHAGPYSQAVGLRVALPANTTSVSFSDHPIADYDQICYEVRAVADDGVGPAASVCDRRDPGEVSAVSVEPGAVGELIIEFTADADDAQGFWLRTDPIGFPCLVVEWVDRDAHVAEFVPSTGDQIRSYSVTVEGLTSGEPHRVMVLPSPINGPGPCLDGPRIDVVAP